MMADLCFLFPFSALLLSLSLPVLDAAREVVYRYDFSNEKIRKLGPSAEIVPDQNASGGKALKLSFKAGRWTPAFAHTRQTIHLSGPIEITLRLRGHLPPGLSESLRLKASFRNEKTGQTVSIGTLPQSTRLAENEYRRLPFRIRLSPAPAPYNFYLNGFWLHKEEPTPPRVWVDSVELRAPGPAAPYLARVEPARAAFRPGKTVHVTATIVNPTKVRFSGSVAMSELFGLSDTERRGRKKVTLEVGQIKELALEWKARGPEAGRELLVQLLNQDRQVIDAATEFFGVARDPSFLATIPGYSADSGQRGRHGVLYVGPASYAQTLSALNYFKARRIQRMEFFSWSYNELAQFIPPKNEDPFLGNEGIWWQSFKKLKRQFRLFKEVGITPITYINGHLWGPAAYRLYQQHPDWFMYTRSGEILGNHYDMEWREKYKHRDEFEFVQEKSPFFYGVLIPTLPEARKHIAGQIIRVATELGFEGARWDVWSMDIKPGFYDLFGHELVKDWKESDRLWSESLANIKARVAKKAPHFTWGYNYASPQENEKTPLVLAEKCRGGGWLLDEVAAFYFAKTSPYHYWDKYRDYMVQWGNRIRELGGIYNPFAFHRGGGKYPVDRLYEGIFRLLGSGRASNIYENQAGKIGNLGHLAFRYSNLFLGPKLRAQPATQRLIRVAAPDTLWWKPLVFSNVNHHRQEQAIVHLVNSPLSKEIEENPDSKLRMPVQNIKVTCGRKNGRLPTRAWLVTAEPLQQRDEPAVQAVELAMQENGDNVQVTVPWLFVWKAVVFDY